jgi:D-alanyl-D-alanine carboxypeptidase/D-alanyl-D-alanine-endopeptidase (penicillin-binding protein 4)
VDAGQFRKYDETMPVPPQLSMTRYRSRPQARRSQRRRRLACLFVLSLVVALIVTLGLSEAARGSHRPHRHAGAARDGTALRSTKTPHPSAIAAASPNPRPFAVAPNSPVTTALQRHILTILGTNGLLGAGTAVCVYDLSTARLLFARRSATPLRPASNEKLLTSATALSHWGASHRFATDLYQDGTLAPDGVFRGSLYLKGYGDPSLSTASFERYDLHLHGARLEDFVRALKLAGIKRIDGRIVGDGSYFDSLHAVASWHADEIDDCGPLAALSLDEGLDSRGCPVRDPALYAAATLTRLVRRADIPVSRAAATGVTPHTATLLYQDRSAPLATILASMNRRSDDFFAEMLTKGLGAAFAGKGSTAAGVRVERAYARAEGIDLDRVVVGDGSGLSYADRETAANLVRLLVFEAQNGWWPVFYRSLAVAGESGTLADRMRGTAAQGDVHAKTGTLNVASSLSGYVTAANGHLLAFSILTNGDPLDLAAAQQAQDEIGVALARSRPTGRVVWRGASGA